MSEKIKNRIFPAFKAAFPFTLPVMTGYVFLGISYGIYMNVSGFSFLYPMLMAITIFGGSLEFLAVFVVAALHIWKRKILLSMAGGTACYMLLVQFIF